MRGKPIEIKTIIERVLKKLGGDERVIEGRIHSLWKQIVGESIFEHTKPIKLEKGFLLVHVDSPVWLNDLNRYSKTEIIKKVNEALEDKKIRTITFKIGKVN